MPTLSGMSVENEQYLLDKYQKLGDKKAMLKLMWQEDPLNVVWDQLRKVEREMTAIERIVGYFPNAK